MAALAERKRHELLHGDLANSFNEPGGSTRKWTRALMKSYSNFTHRVAVSEDDTWSPARRRLAGVLNHFATEILLTVVMGLNLIFAIRLVDTEASGHDVPIGLLVAMKVSFGLYCAEVSARLFVYRGKYFDYGVNQFDFVIVVVDVLASFAEMRHEMKHFDFAPFRIVRTMRLLRSARILVHFRSLYMLVSGMVGAMRAVIWALILISMALVLCSIFAVAVIHPYVVQIAETTDAFDGCARCHVAYASVWNAYMTFFQQVIAGDSWGLVTIRVMDEHPWTVMFFIPVFLTIHLGLINTVLTVIVDRAQDAREASCALRLQVKEQELESAHKQLEEVCASMDVDGSGEITLEEVLDGYDNNATFYRMLRLMDISKDDMKCVFTILDQDKSGSCTYDEFVDSLWKMKAQDSHTLLVFIKSYVTDVKHSLEETIRTLRGDVAQKIAELHAVHYEIDDVGGSTPLHSPRHSVVDTVPIEPVLQPLPDPTSGCNMEHTAVQDNISVNVNAKHGHETVTVKSTATATGEDVRMDFCLRRSRSRASVRGPNIKHDPSRQDADLAASLMRISTRIEQQVGTLSELLEASHRDVFDKPVASQWREQMQHQAAQQRRRWTTAGGNVADSADRRGASAHTQETASCKPPIEAPEGKFVAAPPQCGGRFQAIAENR